jgi:hypothetical protein
VTAPLPPCPLLFCPLCGVELEGPPVRLLPWHAYESKCPFVGVSMPGMAWGELKRLASPALAPSEPYKCGTCAGQPLASGRTCVCDGIGTEEAEIRGLRIEAIRLQESALAPSAAAVLAAVDAWGLAPTGKDDKEIMDLGIAREGWIAAGRPGAGAGKEGEK